MQSKKYALIPLLQRFRVKVYCLKVQRFTFQFPNILVITQYAFKTEYVICYKFYFKIYCIIVACTGIYRANQFRPYKNRI